MGKINYKIILMAPLPPPFGGIGQWAKRFLELAPKYNLSADIVDETKNKGGHFFGKNSKISFFAQLKRNRSIWNELKAKLNITTAQGRSQEVTRSYRWRRPGTRSAWS